MRLHTLTACCIVILQPTDEAKLAEYQKHKFMIQSMILSDNIPTPENISYAVSLPFLYECHFACSLPYTPDKNCS